MLREGGREWFVRTIAFPSCLDPHPHPHPYSLLVFTLAIPPSEEVFEPWCGRGAAEVRQRCVGCASNALKSCENDGPKNGSPNCWNPDSGPRLAGPRLSGPGLSLALAGT